MKRIFATRARLASVLLATIRSRGEEKEREEKRREEEQAFFL